MKRNRKTRFYDTQKIVKEILTVSEAARNSDMLLYSELVKIVAPHAANKPFCEVLTNLHGNSLPPFETVRRTRQKVQADYPWLRCNEDIQIFRNENERAYEEYAVGR